MNKFRRPLFAVVFYALAVALALLTILLGGAVILGFGFPQGQLGAVGALFQAYVFVMMIIGCVQALCIAAVGYGIEKLAEVAWNTRPEHLRASLTQPNMIYPGAVVRKCFFVFQNGASKGPYSESDMLNLYRDGRLTIESQIYVEENGIRRMMRNWSEIGLGNG
jgi:hypothetical protein